MKTFHISKPDQMILKIVSATFPSYRGKSFSLSTSIPSRLDSYWDGGSKDEFCFYHLDEHKSFSVASNHPYFERHNPSHLEFLPPRILLVKHCYFCGKDMGITIYANESDITKMLPAPADVSENEKIVLKYTAHLKNTYGGETNIRFREANREKGITQDEWNAAQNSCIAKGLLRKNGSITPDGRNAY